MEKEPITKLRGMYRIQFAIEGGSTLDILCPHIPRIGDEIDLQIDGFSGEYKVKRVILTAYDGLAYNSVKRKGNEVAIWVEKLD
ncbi:MAG: hypothetical protein WBF90_32160 [Rivularia sp. (in: cyanobacteria)]